jgi:hypothetical protein
MGAKAMSLYGPSAVDVRLSRERRERLYRLGFKPPQRPRPKAPEPPSVPLPAEKPVPPPPYITRHKFWIIDDGPPKVIDIQLVVAEHFKTTMTKLMSHRRTKDVVWPRQVAMYLCKELTLKSLPEIGRRFRHFDHTTVLHAVRKVERLVTCNLTIAAEIETLRRLIVPATGATEVSGHP